MFSNQKVAESSTFFCEKCEYITNKKCNYEKHMLTSKHLKSTKINQKVAKSSAEFYRCEVCDREYKDKSGLWRHKKKCDAMEKNTEITHDNILYILKQNSELQQMLIEQNKTIIELSKANQINNSHNTITNSNNKTFNLQLFLNETCKDAMNIMDFVDSIKLQLSDLEKVGEIGYIEGISNIIVKNLKELDVSQRPVHCTDKKRETIYIKDENKWEKDEEKKKMHKVIKKVADKNARLLPEFKKVYPDYNKASSKFSDQYNKIIIESMGGQGDDDYEKEEKIIKKISKEVTVEKE
jgi:hypothetical protein